MALKNHDARRWTPRASGERARYCWCNCHNASTVSAPATSSPVVAPQVTVASTSSELETAWPSRPIGEQPGQCGDRRSPPASASRCSDRSAGGRGRSRLARRRVLVSASTWGPDVSRIAHQADPPGRRLEQVAQHRTELVAVVVGHHRIGGLVELADRQRRLTRSRGPGSASLPRATYARRARSARWRSRAGRP